MEKKRTKIWFIRAKLTPDGFDEVFIEHDCRVNKKTIAVINSADRQRLWPEEIGVPDTDGLHSSFNNITVTCFCWVEDRDKVQDYCRQLVFTRFNKVLEDTTAMAVMATKYAVLNSLGKRYDDEQS